MTKFCDKCFWEVSQCVCKVTEEQPYGGKPPHQKHSDTSREAAEKAMETAKSLRAKIWRWFRVQPDGATDEELIDAFGGPGNANAVRPRRCELVRLGIIVDSGRTRPNRSSRDAVVWIIRGGSNGQEETAA
jgi:hypothetical protein